MENQGVGRAKSLNLNLKWCKWIKKQAGKSRCGDAKELEFKFCQTWSCVSWAQRSGQDLLLVFIKGTDSTSCLKISYTFAFSMEKNLPRTAPLNSLNGIKVLKPAAEAEMGDSCRGKIGFQLSNTYKVIFLPCSWPCSAGRTLSGWQCLPGSTLIPRFCPPRLPPCCFRSACLNRNDANI